MNAKHTLNNYRELFLSERPLMDVRAPVEFVRGHFNQALNLPLLDDQQRQEIGLKYKQQGQDAAIELGHVAPLPAVVATSARSLELVEKAMRDHVMAYLIEPILSEDLQAAIIVAWARYLELAHLEAQVDDMKTALEDRKIIERAKGILMASESIGEGEAFGVLRSRSQDNREKMVDVARRILDEAKEEAQEAAEEEAKQES